MLLKDCLVNPFNLFCLAQVSPINPINQSLLARIIRLRNSTARTSSRFSTLLANVGLERPSDLRSHKVRSKASFAKIISLINRMLQKMNHQLAEASTTLKSSQAGSGKPRTNTSIVVTMP